jgi:protein-tyrosine phosphatase
MIDLHAHILPGLDDGAADVSESLALAGIYVAAGFACVVATPHAIVGEMAVGYARTVSAAVERLNHDLQHHALPLRVLPGMEVTLDPRLPDLASKGTVLTLAGKQHLLVETPFGRLPFGWRNLVFDLGARGLTVLFAHPERCEQLMADPGILKAMVAAGARLQVNWDSFGGAFGGRSLRLAHWMADNGLIHCLATDSHNPQKRHPGRIGPIAAELGERIGAANLRRISQKNPERALGGLPMLDMDLTLIAEQAAKRKWWRRWLAA